MASHFRSLNPGSKPGLPMPADIRRTLYLLVATLVLAGCTAPGTTPTRAGPTTATPSAPAASRYALTNAGFESTDRGPRGDPPGWFSFQHAGDLSYRYVVDTAEPRSGARSLRIDNIGPEPYGAVAQSVRAGPYRGKVAKLTAWLRTKDANDNGAVLTLLVLAAGATLEQNFMLDRPVKGTTPWTRYTITIPVARSADAIEVGAMMRGKGSLWFDDVEVEFVDP
jgi:hypothetical protein